MKGSFNPPGQSRLNRCAGDDAVTILIVLDPNHQGVHERKRVRCADLPL